MPLPTKNHVLVTLDQLNGFWSFLKTMYSHARERESGPAIAALLDRHQREVGAFNATVSDFVDLIEADGEREVLARNKSGVQTVRLGHEHQLEFEDTLEWCMTGERLAEKVLDVALGAHPPVLIERMMHAELDRVRTRRVALEAMLAALRSDAGVSTDHGTPKRKQLLLVELTTAQRDVVTTTFLAHGIPSVSAAGAGEAVYRIVQDRPTLVLLSGSALESLGSIVEQLNLSDPHVPVLSIDPKSLPESVTNHIRQVIDELARDEAAQRKL